MIAHIYKEISINHFKKLIDNWCFLFLIFTALLPMACQEDIKVEVSNGDPISLTASTSELTLDQKESFNNAITFNWTTGSNQRTGSAISYVLEIDKAGSEFAGAKVYDFGKQIYEKSIMVEDLNAMLLENWGILPGENAEFEARVKAIVANSEVAEDISEVVLFTVTPFEPVSTSLYIVGSATSADWNITEAIEMVPDSDSPWIFVFEGQLSPGNFKFPVNQEDCWCQDFYTKDPANDGRIVYNEGGSGDDLQWEIIEGSPYKIEVDLLEMTIQIEKQVGPAYTELYIVGDASPSGWNIASPEAFTVDPNNPFVFTYEAHLTPGEFKISTYQGDWCDGDWLNATQADQTLDATDYTVRHGCDGDDFKWRVTDEAEGRYKITVNLSDQTIRIEEVVLYLIGDGGPNGWNIGTPEPMTYSNGIYTFNGELGSDNTEGEFKISKFKGDWCNGDWINAATANQSLSNTDFIITHGCDGPDNKWKLVSGDAGTYEITIDLDNEVMTINKQ